MIDKIILIMGQIFDEKIERENLESITPETIEKWDSIAHLNLIVALEDELEISFEQEEILEMQKGALKIIEIIKERVQL